MTVDEVLPVVYKGAFSQEVALRNRVGIPWASSHCALSGRCKWVDVRTTSVLCPQKVSGPRERRDELTRCRLGAGGAGEGTSA